MSFKNYQHPRRVVPATISVVVGLYRLVPNAIKAFVDFGFKVALAEFEKSKRYGKSVPLRFRFQLRLDRFF